MTEPYQRNAQAREQPDPHEQGRPIPAIVLLVACAALAWAVGYIVLHQDDAAPHLGDRRTVASLQGKPGGATGTADGAQLYAAHCLACHQAAGTGLAGVFPPLAQSEWVLAPERVPISILLHGVNGSLTVKGAVYNGQMPAFKDKLSDADIAAVLTHIRTRFGNAAPAVQAATVAAERLASKERNEPWNGDDDLKKLQP